MNNTITISKKEYDELMSAKLMCEVLYAHGVQDWDEEEWEEAMKTFEEEKSK